MFLTDIRKKSSSIKFAWLFSYILILLIPVIMSLIVYYESSKTLEGEINKANISTLDQATQTLENDFNVINQLNTEIMWNGKLLDLLGNGGTPGYNMPYNLHQTALELKNLTTLYNYIDGLYVYYITQDTIIYPGVYGDSRTMYKFSHNANMEGYDQWLDLLKKRSIKKYTPMELINDNGKVRKTIAYVNSITPLGKNEPPATIVLFIDQDKLKKSLEKILWIKGCETIILDRDNQVLLSTSDDSLSRYLDYGMLTGEKGLQYEKINGESYAISYVSPINGHMKYVSLIPEKTFWQKAEYVRKLTFISILLSILGGGFLTYFFLQRNYNPISTLIRSVAEKSGTSYNMGLNEFKFIQETLSNTIDEKMKMGEFIKKQNDSLKSAFLTRLVKGRLDETVSIDESLHTFGIEFYSDAFVVILLYIEEYDGLFVDEPNLNPNEKFKLTQFIITNVVEELCNQNNCGFICEVDDMLACLVNIKDTSNPTIKKELVRIATESRQLLTEKMNIHVTLSISDIHHSIPSIPQAYDEAIEAMEYKLVVGSSEIICYNDIHHDRPGTVNYNYFYPLALEQQLMNNIKAGNFDKSKEVLDTVLQNNMARPSISIHAAKCLMFGVISTIAKTIDEIGGFEDNSFLEKLNPMPRLFNCSTLKDMQRELISILEEVCDYTTLQQKDANQLQKDNHTKQLIDSVIQFVEDNYANNNLNISMIGDKFDKTPTYLSKLFKQYTGEGLLDYISKYKIQKAKLLLETNSMTINEISKILGFSDTATFIRSFKKYEGITPGQYKNMKY